MSDSITLPLIRLSNGEVWIPTQSLGSKILFRASSIHIKGKISDPSGHRMEQAEAEGSVKLRPKSWGLNELKL